MNDPLARRRLEMDRIARRLARRRINAVTYWGLGSFSDPSLWDISDWHLPVMGVELRLDDGAPVSAVWGSDFGHFGLELYASPMTDHVTALDVDDGGPNHGTVTDHPRWAALLIDPIVDARLVWAEGYADRQGAVGPVAAPLALRLNFPNGRIRIIAAMEHTDDRWWLGADEVIVAFTDEFAASIGYPDND
ncbi:hypothetical protein AB0M47_07015 [Hamadaea sp. NPDC051192]|uniref:hypothetical protein n=1 Tax=Hamadaea sp. NPDC051192 TaxID=3154940 RepID=UPI0034424EDE